MISFRKYLLTEALKNAAPDQIELIASPLKPHLKAFEKILASNDSLSEKRKQMDPILKSLPDGKVLKTFSSDVFKSHGNAREAHIINPIKIEVGVLSNSYSPFTKLINVGIAVQVSGAKQLPLLTASEIKRLTFDLNYDRFKSSVAHELAHWIDDSLHNLHMTKASTKGTAAFYDHVAAGKKDVYLGPIEIQAVANQIAHMKLEVERKKPGAWDQLTWKSMIKLIPSVEYLNQRLGAEWRKKIFPRLAREGLLGKNMRA